MAGFHDIIGHDDIIRHLKNANRDRGRCPTLIFFTGEPGLRQETSCGGLCGQHCSVNQENLNRV